MEALTILERMGLKVTLKGKGKVKRQSLRSGSAIKSNSTITLELS
jgi:cell division protein FtsI (penicillin-binding protein 3)